MGMEQRLLKEVKEQLSDSMIPFWENMIDKEYGGYYGCMNYQLKIINEAEKGCILNSRILWFFSNAYLALQDPSLLADAKHAYEFLINCMADNEFGGVYWSVSYDGKPEDTTKHTYNQAFAIYALSSYYDASKDKQALKKAFELFELVEEKCVDEHGYLEAFNCEFKLVDNDKLSENGVIADKTMNTLLHVFEAYTELYRVSKDDKVADRMGWILDIIATKVFNKDKKRQEVFFDKEMNSILDLHSYGHDIETAWLIDRGVNLLEKYSGKDEIFAVTKTLEEEIYAVAFDGNYIYNECEKGVVDKTCIWWVQAEAMVGFLNAFEKFPSKKEYFEAVFSIWEYIKENVIDKRTGSEWFWEVNEEHEPNKERNIVDMWKCPYHNGRMYFEIMRRLKNDT